MTSTLSHPQPNDIDIPRNILAFRTITRMLASIQQERPFQFSLDNSKISGAQHRELKISNAFANLAVAEHDVIAVATVQSPDELNVVACSHSDSNDESPPSTSPNTQSRCWNFFFASNPRREQRDDALKNCPVVVDAKAPAGLDDDEAKLWAYVESRRGPTTLAEHLWILGKLLVMKDPPGDGSPAADITGLERLQYYIIATCYRKMERRLGHKTLSQPYIHSLKQVKDVPFNESLWEQPSTREIASDRSFLLFLLNVIHQLRTPIPHIHEQAKLVAANQEFQLYNENTCKEFHFLFLELLQGFQRSLENLKKHGDSAGVTSNCDNNQFREYVVTALLNGFALQTIAKSAALRMHLRTIEAKLVDHRRPDMSMLMPGGNAETDEKQDEEQDERDEELEAVQPSAISMEENVPVPVPLWKSYRNWLKLMVVYFDAAHTLVNYIAGTTFNNRRISLKILVAPLTDTASLPWRELFTDSKLFPTENEADPLSTTNNEILKILNEAASSNMTQCLQSINAVRRCWNQKNKDATIKNLAKLDKTLFRKEMVGWHQRASNLHPMIKDYYEKLSKEQWDNITNEIESLFDSARFFALLSKWDDFTGALHCEACLTSLLPVHLGKDVTIDSKHEHVLAQMKNCGRIIGISKRCCPTCRHLLSLLTKGRDPFIVGGSHSTITACTLPTWIPGHIVDSMNKFFGSQLRRELIDFMGRSKFLRARAPSTGSQRLSLDSVEDLGIQATVSAKLFGQGSIGG